MLLWLQLKMRFQNTFWKPQNNFSLGILDKRVFFWKPFLLILPSILAIILFTLIPFVLTIQESLLVGSGQNKHVGIQNYETFVTLTYYKVAIRNTILYAVLSMPISIIISLMISSAIVHIVRKVIRDTWLSIFFLPYMTSAVAVSTAFWFMFSTNNGLINTILGQKIPWLSNTTTNSWEAFGAILINGVWGNLAFQILILTTSMLSVNKDLYKSSAIDGSNKRVQFFKITLPSINRSMNFLITIGIIGAIKVFPLALFNNNADAAMSNNGSTLMLLIYAFTKNGDQFNFSGTASVVTFIIGILTTALLSISICLIVKGSLMFGEYRVKTKINRAKLLY